MVAHYKVEFRYPDGHIEEIDEIFRNIEKAVEYGNSMLVQVANTERFHTGGRGDNAHYRIIEYSDAGRKVIKDSREQ